MSEWDIKGLEANFQVFHKDRYPELPIAEAFERFAVRQILKDEDLSDDELEAGIIGGGDDGGIDGIYFFVNQTLIDDEGNIPEEVSSARVVIVQAKYQPGFGEAPIQKLESFARDLLDHSRDVDGMNYLNGDVRDAIRRFRTNYGKILATKHTMKVSFCYASKSDQDPNIKVTQRAEQLKQYVRQQISLATTDVEFWGCQRLLASARTIPTSVEVIDFTREFTSHDGGAVCLVKLGDFAKLLRDENGEIRRRMLEPNVRDYQGENIAVNRAIRETLKNPGPSEFWWLNNGVTILAKHCSIAGGKLRIENPEVVNGLQTSYEIFNFFKPHPDKDDPRNVLVRVIVPPNEQVRSKVIRATNSQTSISDVSLHATDPIHFDIEDRMKLYGLWYERRKGEYRELKKPADQIISMQTLGRAVIAVMLQQPNNAYGSPGRVLKDSYAQIFSDAYNRDMFVACILIERQAERYLVGRGAEMKDFRSFARYYIAMMVACELLKQATAPTDKQLAALLPTAVKPIDGKFFDEATESVMKAYKAEGATEIVPKGGDMRAKLLDALSKKFGPQGKLKV